jgi:hypothetical protein
VRTDVNALRRRDGTVALVWRIRAVIRRALVLTAIALLVMTMSGFSVPCAITAVGCAAIAVGLFAIVRARRIPALLAAAANDAATQLGVRAAAGGQEGT